MGFPKRVKDPDAVLDYPSDWSDWLPEGDTITSATATLSDATMTVDSVSHTTTTVVAYVSGGSVGVNPVLTFHVVTAEGREDDRSITLVCKER